MLKTWYKHFKEEKTQAGLTVLFKFCIGYFLTVVNSYENKAYKSNLVEMYYFLNVI